MVDKAASEEQKTLDLRIQKVSEKVLERLRARKGLDEYVVHDLIKHPLLDFIIERVKPEDKTLILDMLNNSSGGVQHLAVFLCRGIPDDNEIVKHLIALFRQSDDVYLKYLLLAEITRRDSSDAIKREMLRFIENNYDLFLQWEVEFFGGTDKVLGACEGRLGDSFFQKKSWIYLISLGGADNRAAARKLICSFAKHRDPFLREIAAFSLKRIQNNVGSILKGRSLSINLIFAVSLIAFCALWGLVSYAQFINTLFLPTPPQLLESVRSLFLDKGFIIDISISVFRVVSAFLLSIIIAVPLAILMCSYKKVYDLLSPYMDFTRYLPVPTLIPLTILFFGIDEEAKIVLLFIGTFFQLILLIIDNIHNIPREYYDLAYTLNFGRVKVMALMFRSILPQIYDNSRITLGWCWTYLIIAELVASERGIGHMIKEAQRFSNTADVYVGIITMGIIGFLSDYAFKKGYPYLFKYENRITESKPE